MMNRHFAPISTLFPARLLREASRVPVLLWLLLTAGCSSFDVVNGLTRSGHYDSHRDIAYAGGDRHRLDVHVPPGDVRAAPIIVFFYGGGWREGSKADYEFVASRLTAAGFIVVLPDYRLYPSVAFPAFVEDAALALRWAYEHAPEFGGDAQQLFVAGHSAGAQIAALLALDARYLQAVGLERSAIAGLIGLSGPYDFLPLERGYLLKVFPEQSRADSQPVAFVDAGAPRTLLVHGTNDNTVYPLNSERLAARLREAGVPIHLRLYDGVGHGRVVAALASPLDRLAPTADDVIDFVRQHIGAAAD